MAEDQTIWMLLAKKLSGEINSVEEEQLTELIANASEDEKHGIRHAETILKQPEIESDYQPNLEDGWIKFQQKAYPTSLGYTKWLKIAASIFMVVCLGYLISLVYPFGQDTLVSDTGIRKVELPDGSIVWLNQGAELSIEHFGKTERAVRLTGEAFFDVEKMPEKRFVIHMNTGRIEVLGTSFNVNAQAEEIAVQVETGKVALIPTKSRNPVLLNKGEEVSYNSGNSETVKPKSIENQNFRAWQNKKISFRNSTMKIVEETLEEYFNVEIDVHENLAACRFTASFQDPDLQHVLEVLSLTGDFNVTKESNSYAIDGISCKK